MLSTRLILAASVFVGAVLGSAAELMAADIIMNGTIKSSAGQALGGVMVSAKPEGGTITTTVLTDEGGRYYFPQDPALLPSIFIKEAKTLKRSMLQNKVFTPEVSFPSPMAVKASSSIAAFNASVR